MGYEQEYKEKLVSADEAVKVVKSDTFVDWGFFNGKPLLLDQAMARRHEELRNVSIYTAVSIPPIPEVCKYPESFVYHDWQWSKVTRMIKQAVPVYYSPILYHQGPFWYRNGLVPHKNVAMLRVAPMDKYGYFNFGPQNSESMAKCEMADIVIVEVLKSMPVCLGGEQASVHISMVDYIVEAPDDHVLPNLPGAEPSEVDIKIADHIMNYIYDGCCVQLGIGGMPNAVGKQIADSDLKNLGGHTEMFVDAYVDMIESGRMNGAMKEIDLRRVSYTFALGSTRMYDYMDNNPTLASYCVDYTNDPRIISRLSNFVSINNAVQVDLYTQVNAESDGFKQISGNGGMWDFVLGSQWSEGGQSFICLASTYKDSAGKLQSRIVPTFTPGSITTIPRQMVDYIVTEYGAEQMSGKSTWQRAEKIINLAHPDFRDDLIKNAGEMGIWRQSNKISG